MQPIRIAFFAAAAFTFAACDNATGPGASGGRVDADLKDMAAKVRYFDASAQANPSRGGGGDPEGLFKRSADDCIYEGHSVNDYYDTTAAGVDHNVDTTDSFTAEGNLACGEDDIIAYAVTSSYSSNALLESWLRMRMDYPEGGGIDGMKVKGSGRLHYLDGYDIRIPRFEVEFDLTVGIRKFEYDLELDGGKYLTTLSPDPDWNPMLDSEPDGGSLALSGPITLDGQVVGYFEVMGDDSVVIRDADKHIVSVHE